MGTTFWNNKVIKKSFWRGKWVAVSLNEDATFEKVAEPLVMCPCMVPAVFSFYWPLKLGIMGEVGVVVVTENTLFLE